MEIKSPSLNTASLKASLQKLTVPIAHHSTVIMLLASFGILIYSILAVQTTISSQDDNQYRQDQLANRISGKFDTETINKINNLKASSDSSTITLPSGRRNPFIN